jgi:uncharacterized membrane protein
MLDNFMLHPLPNTLAVIVLGALIFSWFTSIVLALKDAPTSFSQGWYTRLILVFSLLGIPAIFDLFQTSGIAFVFAVIAGLMILLNIAVLIMRLAKRSSHSLVKDWFKWSVPVLAIGGLAVAGYFVFLELTDGTVMCGPSDGCGPVQSSRYAKLFGVVPMGRFGFAGYLAILAGWLLWQYGPISLKKLGSLSMWGFCVFGVLFSTYLTFLEPFVIGSTCMWCITSAVFMVILLLVSTPAAQQALAIHEEEEFFANHA